jgi:outer membrane biosynthesis protein TonB
MSEGSGKQSAAAAAADKVRGILEAAEQSAAELRAEAAHEIDAQLERAQVVTARLSERADQIERSLQGLADSVRDELSALKADLEELRAVGEGVAEKRAESPAAAEAKPAPDAEPAAERPPQPPTEPRPEPRPVPPAEPPPPDSTALEAAEPAEAAEPEVAAPGDPASELAAEQPAGDGHEGVRVIALNMALSGSPREETARYLAENFELEDPDALLDDVYARAGR